MTGSGKVALFIDGEFLHQTARHLGFKADFGRLLNEIGKAGVLRRTYYYATLKETVTSEIVDQLSDWLASNRILVRMKRFDPGEERSFVREVESDAIDVAEQVVRVVICSGENALAPAVQEMRRQGLHVTVLASHKIPCAGRALELAGHADAFIELETLRPAIERRSPRVRGKEDAAHFDGRISAAVLN
jgi:uncharacterized LabA/DUF88 family protein